MVAFVLDPSLFRFWNNTPGNAESGDRHDLRGKKYRRSDLFKDAGPAQPPRTSLCTRPSSHGAWSTPTTYTPPQLFGDLNRVRSSTPSSSNTRPTSCGCPRGKKVATDWLSNRLGSVNGDAEACSELALSRFNGQANRVSGETILADIASQVRISNASQLLGTPLDTRRSTFSVPLSHDQSEARFGAASAVPDGGLRLARRGPFLCTELQRLLRTLQGRTPGPRP